MSHPRKATLRLADTTIRMYRKANGGVSLRLRTFLMIYTKSTTFSLSAYLESIACSLTLASGKRIEFGEVAFSEDCLYELDTMVHDLWAVGESSPEILKAKVGKLRMDYRLFWQDEHLELIVPLVWRGAITSSRAGSSGRVP